MIDRRMIPALGKEISRLGYGGMRFPKNGDEVDMDAAVQLLRKAYEMGINYFDTAMVYHKGESEKIFGKAFEPYPRDSYLIADKMSIWLCSDEEDMKARFYNQLKTLKTEYIDFYLVHSLNRNHYKKVKDLHCVEFLQQMKQEGKIKHLGFSFHDTYQVFTQILNDYTWDFVQIQLNYVDWRHATGNNVNAEYLYGELAKRNIAAVIMEPLLGGRLSNVPEHIVGRLKQRRPEDSVASWAFRFAGSPELVLTVLSGMTYMEHLQDNIRTYSPLVPLTDDDKEYLEETAQLMMQYPTIPCNDCKYCMPCPYGIDIPAILVHYNKCVNEGNIPQSQSSENYKEARRAFLVGYDRSVPKLRQASHCIGCNQCTPHCPQSIHIPEELHRIDRFVEQLKQGTL